MTDKKEHRGLVRASDVEIAAPDPDEAARIAAHSAVQAKRAQTKVLRKVTRTPSSPGLHAKLERSSTAATQRAMDEFRARKQRKAKEKES